MVMTAAPNRVVWVDLSTTDLESAIHFYERIFGWHYEEHDSGMQTNVVARVAGGEVGGMMAQPPEQAASGVPSAWTVFVGCGHLENALTWARELGGSVLQAPVSIPGGARVAVIADPSGAALALAEGALAVGTAVRDEPGALAWVECQSRDLARSRGFYEELFGWQSEEGTDGYVVFTADGERAGGLMAMPRTVPAEVHSHWLVYFAAEVAATADAVTELGGTVVVPAHEIDEGRFAVLEDPTGAVFAIYERSP
ncbi:MAG TPA: VOC family protein [Acidimicrobiales bacterium]|nr:VOC family protein [Acidimicrobiales bacterium]